MKVTEPILVIAFNRPDHLASVLERLRTVGASCIYLAIDGPRKDRPGEADRVQACRELVGRIDWPCEVHTLFHDDNLGCGLGVSSAISWFFTHVVRGIIVEDEMIGVP